MEGQSRRHSGMRAAGPRRRLAFGRGATGEQQTPRSPTDLNTSEAALALLPASTSGACRTASGKSEKEACMLHRGNLCESGFAACGLTSHRGFSMPPAVLSLDPLCCSMIVDKLKSPTCVARRLGSKNKCKGCRGSRSSHRGDLQAPTSSLLPPSPLLPLPLPPVKKKRNATHLNTPSSIHQQVWALHASGTDAALGGQGMRSRLLSRAKALVARLPATQISSRRTLRSLCRMGGECECSAIMPLAASNAMLRRRVHEGPCALLRRAERSTSYKEPLCSKGAGARALDLA